MKYKLLLLLSLFPFIANAQISTVTEAQKQQALQTVSKFCTLFTQWANGQRTLDTQIYALCSGNDCSAYDDVSTEKETTLRNYLLGIQKKYPKSLTMQISQPSLTNSSITYEQQLTVNDTWEAGSESAVYGTTIKPDIQVAKHNNAFIVFDVTHSLPSLNKSFQKKIIYDVKTAKITAFVTGNGTFISYLQGYDLITKKDYINAISKFAYAATNNRSTIVKRSNEIISSLYALIGDYHSAAKYADIAGDKYLSMFYTGMVISLEKEKYDEALAYFLKCENLIDSTIHKNTISYLHHFLALCYLLGQGDTTNALYYYKKSANEGWVASGYAIYNMRLLGVFDDKEISHDEAFVWLRWAAENGYPPAFFDLGQYEEYVKENTDEALVWYEKAARSNNPIGMACLGKLLIKKGSSNIEIGKTWLRKSLESNTLEKYLEDYEAGGNLPKWPTSRSEVQKLLDKTQINSTTSSSTTSVYPNTNNNSNTSSATTSNSTYTPTTTSNNSYKYNRRKFNQAQDSFIGGFSIGYIQKQWTVEENGEKEKYGLFDDDKYLQGIQAGFRIDPQFGGGLGINTGLFYEYCWAKSNNMSDSYGTYHFTYEEHGLYLPLHLKFTMNFSKWFQLSLYGGAGFNYVLSGNSYLRSDGDTYDSENVFSEEEDWKRFNAMLEYGISIRIKAIQIDITQSQGLNKWSDTDGIKIKQGRPLSISATFCF